LRGLHNVSGGLEDCRLSPPLTSLSLLLILNTDNASSFAVCINSGGLEDCWLPPRALYSHQPESVAGALISRLILLRGLHNVSGGLEDCRLPPPLTSLSLLLILNTDNASFFAVCIKFRWTGRLLAAPPCPLLPST